MLSDHLGSTRAVVSVQGDILETIDYRPFGEVLHSQGEGARTGYIDREEDGESGLGCYGVRLYEPEYGRFTSVDPLWEMYAGFSSYQYSLNCPIKLYDYGGAWVQAMDARAEKAIVNSVSGFEEYITFGDDGILNVELVKEGAKGQDPNSNIAILSRLAQHDETIQVEVAHTFSTSQKADDSFDATRIDDDGDVVYTYTNALTLPPTRHAEKTGLPSGAPTSATGSYHVVIDSEPKTQFFKGSPGQLVAHELYVHVSRALKMLGGKAKAAWHDRSATGDAAIEQKKMSEADKRARSEACE